jgi:hypothetical protein
MAGRKKFDAEGNEIPKGPGSGRPYVGGKGSGIPAGGYDEKPPSGMPAAGPGWGGAASGTPAAEFKGGAIEPADEDRRARKLRRSMEMEDVIYSVAKDEKAHGTVRVMAASKLHEMYNGKPVERVIVDEQPIERDVIDPADLSPEAREELRAALERTMDRGPSQEVH